jgi:hypothetical protein
VNSKAVLRKYNKTAIEYLQNTLLGCGYQISLNVLQLQILIQCCKLAQKMHITLHILNTFTAYLKIQINTTMKNVPKRGCTP